MTERRTIQAEILMCLRELNKDLDVLKQKFDDLEDFLEATGYDMYHDQINLPFGDNS